MKKNFLTLLIFIFYTLTANAQNTATLQSPEAYLGYPLSTQFSFHHTINNYFKYIAQSSEKVKLIPYGKSYEGREMLVAVISSKENIQNIEQIRKNNLILANLIEGESKGQNYPIVWFSANVHGNEPASSETAMELLYHLSNSESDTVKQWLDKMIVVIDPCENPDGRSRYVNWYKQKKGVSANANTDTWEHREPWPSGRFNHYIFDLNRDWAWQSQAESQQRLALYQQWMPHIHIDLHEMTPEAPYFFGPAAEPMHDEITTWQRHFHQVAGHNHASHFDARGWGYFSKEIYDLFYPSYGDTWPMFNGAIGFTFEQGGHGKAGIAYKKIDGDTLTLADRIEHHYVSSISTLEVAYKQRNKLLDQFKKFFREDAKGVYKTFVLKNKGYEGKVEALKKLLDRQGIQYNISASQKTLDGFNYFENKDASFEMSEGDLVVSTHQPKSKLVNVLFEPKAHLSDSLTYDLTAWALPYAYNIPACALKGQIKHISYKSPEESTEVYNKIPSEPVYAFIAPWQDLRNSQFLSALIQRDIKVRYATEQFSIPTLSEKVATFSAGAMLVIKQDNTTLKDFEQSIIELANQYGQKVIPTLTGMASSGKDLGSSSQAYIKQPKIALIGGDGVTPTAFGELWYFFDQVIAYPINIINTDDIITLNKHRYNTVVVPSGNYSDKVKKQLMEFCKHGGKVILMESAIDLALHQPDTEIGIRYKKMQDEKKKQEANKTVLPKVYADRARKDLENHIAGSIYKVQMDNTHPLTFGEGASHFIIKRNKSTYPLLEKGWTVGTFGKNSLISGFVGHKLKKEIPNTLAIGNEKYGQGSLIYFSDSPVFRGFWHGSMLLMSNAVFFDF